MPPVLFHSKETKKSSDPIKAAFENGVRYYLRVLSTDTDETEPTKKSEPTTELVIDFRGTNTNKYYESFLKSLKDNKFPIHQRGENESEIIFRGKPLPTTYRWLREHYPSKDTTPAETVVYAGLDSILSSLEEAKKQEEEKLSSPAIQEAPTQPTKFVKQEKLPKDARWVKRTMEELRDTPPAITLQPQLRGTLIGPLLKQLWKPRGETASCQEMCANLSALHKCAAMLHQQTPLKITAQQKNKNEPTTQEHNLPKKKVTNFTAKLTARPKSLRSGDFFERDYLPFWRQQSQEKELALSKCKPEERLDLYHEYLSEILGKINLPVQIVLQTSADGCFYNVELRNQGAVHQRIWSKITDSVAEILATTLNATTLGREPSHLFRSNGYASFQVPVTEDKKIKAVIGEIQKHQSVSKSRA